MPFTVAQMKQRKKELGYSYARIAELSGLPLGTVQKVLGGITENPRHSTLAALARALFPEIPEEAGRSLPAASALSPGSSAGSHGPVPSQSRQGGGFRYDMMPEPDSPERIARILARKAAPAYHTAPDPRLIKLGKKQGEFTLQDRESFPDDLRTELIDGVIYLMASPGRTHQIIAGQIYYQLSSYIYSHDGPCTPFIAPSDVRLDRDDFTVVQPDVYIVCKKGDTGNSKDNGEDAEGSPDHKTFFNDIGKNIPDYHDGAPDFVAEVLSPSTRAKDMTIKAEKYRKAGVREYWIVDPYKEKVIVFQYGEEPDISIFGMNETIPVGIYDGKCRIDFAQIRERVDRYYR